MQPDLYQDATANTYLFSYFVKSGNNQSGSKALFIAQYADP